ncbi:MAG: dienelactone hydrolase family protein [Stellaceae bacterium]
MRSIAALVLLSTALFLPAPASAEEAAWLAGDMVQVAAHRTDHLPLPRTSSEPLMGYLARPDEPGRHPAVIELHGCGGFGTTDVVVADVLRSFGYVALALDSLGDANVCDKNPGDGEIAEAFDAYAALDWLAEQSYVDSNRVALLGFSMGGGATLNGVEPGLIEDKKSRHFRAAIAYYPWCKDRAGLTTVPTQILVGDRDDWTRASWCQEMMARRDGQGSPVELTVYPGATHGFNFPGAPREYLGHHIEYDPKATADAWKQVRRFLQEKLDGSGPADHPGSLRK